MIIAIFRETVNFTEIPAFVWQAFAAVLFLTKKPRENKKIVNRIKIMIIGKKCAEKGYGQAGNILRHAKRIAADK